MNKQAWMVLGFALVWCSLTAAFVVTDLIGLRGQLRTYRFAQAAGIIDQIEQTQDDGDDAITYGVRAAYSYTAAGKLYHGERVRYMAASSSDSWASRFVREHSAGSKVVVYYDPGNPAESVLIQGVEGHDLFMFMFMTPFAGVGVGLLTALPRLRRNRRGFIGVKVREIGPVVRVRPTLWYLWWAMLGSVCGGAFFATFVVMLGLGGFHPTMEAMRDVWMVIAAVAALVTAFVGLMIVSGRWDLRLDGERRVLWLKGRQVAFADIERIEVKKVERKDSDGGNQRSFIVLAKVRDQPKEMRLIKWWGTETQESARRFAAYAALQVGVGAVDDEGKMITGTEGVGGRAS